MLGYRSFVNELSIQSTHQKAPPTDAGLQKLSRGPTDVSWDGIYGHDQERSDKNIGGRRDRSCRTVLCPGRVVQAIYQRLFVWIEYLRQKRVFNDLDNPL